MNEADFQRRPSLAYRSMVPHLMPVPCERSDAMVMVFLEITDGGVVQAKPGVLDKVRSAAADGAVELVEQCCAMWTRWLARVERESCG